MIHSLVSNTNQWWVGGEAVKTMATKDIFAEGSASKVRSAGCGQDVPQIRPRPQMTTTTQAVGDNDVHRTQLPFAIGLASRSGCTKAEKTSLSEAFVQSNPPPNRDHQQQRMNRARSEGQRRGLNQLGRKTHHQFAWRHLDQTGVTPLGQQTRGGDARGTNQLTKTVMR